MIKYEIQPLKHLSVAKKNLTLVMVGLSCRSKTNSNELREFLWGAGMTPYSVATRWGQVIVVWPSATKAKVERY